MIRILSFHKGSLRSFHRNESGAILLFSLAAALILLLLSWTIYDTGPVARDKVELQGAADTSAYSHSAVKARAMNLIAYGNVAKRSIIAITALYPAMYAAYTHRMFYHMSQCFKTWPKWSSCMWLIRNVPQWIRETRNDFDDNADLWGGWFWAIVLGLWGDPGGNIENHHLRDMMAIDNYQRYMFHIAPWWGWSETTVRGLRNGATVTSSWPVPPGQLPGGIDLMGLVNSLSTSVGLGSTGSGGGTTRDQLPWHRMEWESDDFTSDVSMVEFGVNFLHHANRSSKDADGGTELALGTAYYFLFFWEALAEFYDEPGRPWLLKNFQGNQTRWMQATSTLVFAYLSRPDRFGSQRQKFDIPSNDYNYTLGVLDEFTYKPKGMWTLARSEMSYQGDRPNSFRAGWTARMRPVALPGEWGDGMSLNAAYHDVLPLMALLSLLGMQDFSGVTGAIQDFLLMERVSRSFGASTIEGMVK